MKTYRYKEKFEPLYARIKEIHRLQQIPKVSWFGRFLSTIKKFLGV